MVITPIIHVNKWFFIYLPIPEVLKSVLASWLTHSIQWTWSPDIGHKSRKVHRPVASVLTTPLGYALRWVDSRWLSVDRCTIWGVMDVGWDGLQQCHCRPLFRMPQSFPGLGRILLLIVRSVVSWRLVQHKLLRVSAVCIQVGLLDTLVQWFYNWGSTEHKSYVSANKSSASGQ